MIYSAAVKHLLVMLVHSWCIASSCQDTYTAGLSFC